MKMRNATSDLEQFLVQLSRDARPGDRLPPIRDLMHRFGASQMVVQRALQGLKSKGLIASQIGRGTYFLGDGGRLADIERPVASTRAVAVRSPAVRSVLLLRRSVSILRGRVLMEGLQRRFTAEGVRVLEVSYTDPDHARIMLKGLPQFDACVVQSTFKTITIELLAALKEKCDVLAVDGTALAGTEVEAVGTEWGEPLFAAILRLQEMGHRSIAYATTSHPLLASQLGRRRFEALKAVMPGVDLHLISVPHFPDEGYEAGLVDMVRDSVGPAGRPPFTALVAWGIEDGAKFRRLLADIGLAVPSALSVLLLGRTDLANEHADFFDVVGCSVADQVEYLTRAISARWADPTVPHGVRLIPVTSRVGQSIGAPSESEQPDNRGHGS